MCLGGGGCVEAIKGDRCKKPGDDARTMMSCVYNFSDVNVVS